MLRYSKTTTVTATFLLLLATLLSFHIFANDAEQRSPSDNSQSTNDTQTTDQDEVTVETTGHNVGTTAETPEHNVGTTAETPEHNVGTTAETPEHNGDTTEEISKHNGDTTEEKSASKEADRGFNPCLINSKLPVCINNENSDSE